MAILALDAFDPDQARDEHGMWTATGSSAGGQGTLQHGNAMGEEKLGAQHAKRGNLQAGASHYTMAGKLHIALGNHERGAQLLERAKQLTGTKSYLQERKARFAQQPSLHGKALKFRPIPTKDSYNPDQPRDERGRWGEGGPGSGAETAAEHEASAKYHHDEAKVYGNAGHKEAAAAHTIAAKFHETAAKFSNTTERGTRSTAAQSASQQANAASKKIRNQAVSGMVSPREREKMSRDLRRTQTELPVHRDAPVALTAPHSQLPVGNMKPDPTRMGSDPNRTTQKLEAVSDEPQHRFNAGPSDPVHGGSGRSQPYNRDVNKEYERPLSPTNERFVQRMNTTEAKIQEHERAGTAAFVRGDDVTAKAHGDAIASLRASAAPRGRAGTTKESRRDAAAASAGRWASRALETSAAKMKEGNLSELQRFLQGLPPSGKKIPGAVYGVKKSYRGIKTR